VNQRPRVVITDFVADELPIERGILGELAEVQAVDAYSEQDLLGHVEDAAALMVYHNIGISSATIDRLRNCQLIVRCGVGFDNVDWRHAASLGIPVANVPDYGTEEVADSAIAMTLGLTRGTHLLNQRLQRRVGQWSYTQTVPLQRLRGLVFGVVGLGRIGSATALRAKALGFEVIFYDPLKPDGYDKALGIRRVRTLHELLAQSYVVSLHCPLNEQSRLMIDRAAIEQMRRGSYLVNTARGALVATEELPWAIESGQLAGAAIDVLDGEPPADDHPLLVAWRDPAHPCFDRLILNPHAAFYCEQGFEDMRVKGSHACRQALLGQPILNVVNGVRTESV
jgi:D-3-phosphoglycerate dehydrogenase/C-terminal binding protein